MYWKIEMKIFSFDSLDQRNGKEKMKNASNFPSIGSTWNANFPGFFFLSFFFISRI